MLITIYWMLYDYTNNASSQWERQRYDNKKKNNNDQTSNTFYTEEKSGAYSEYSTAKEILSTFFHLFVDMWNYSDYMFYVSNWNTEKFFAFWQCGYALVFGFCSKINFVLRLKLSENTWYAFPVDGWHEHETVSLCWYFFFSPNIPFSQLSF